MAEIRAVRPSDLDDLYRICLATGAGGGDASALYRDPKLLGHVYAAPYAVFSPQSVLCRRGRRRRERLHRRRARYARV